MPSVLELTFLGHSEIKEGVMYVNLEIENFNFDMCKGKLCLKIYVETVTVRPVTISWLRNEEL
jgi:hypothetical protein